MIGFDDTAAGGGGGGGGDSNELQRYLQRVSQQSTSGENNHESQDTYEFVAFILWYTFLVLCCIIPTCCAYRRRRLAESRFTEQQRESFARLQELQHQAQQNMFILSNLQHLRDGSDPDGTNIAGGASSGSGGEPILNERTRRIKAAIKETTFVVKPEDIIIMDDVAATPGLTPQTLSPDIEERQEQLPKEEKQPPAASTESDTKEEKIQQDIEEGGNVDESENEKIDESNEVDDEGGINHHTDTINETGENITGALDYYDADALNMDNYLLQLPQVGIVLDDDEEEEKEEEGTGDEESQTAAVVTTVATPSRSQDPPPNANRTVPGGCAICLCAYEAGDSVSWSKEGECLHAFHTDCIVPWLAKKTEPVCPCCRRQFCTYDRVTQTSMMTTIPLMASFLSESTTDSTIQGVATRRFVYPITPQPLVDTSLPTPIVTTVTVTDPESDLESNANTLPPLFPNTLEDNNLDEEQHQQRPDQQDEQHASDEEQHPQEPQPTFVTPDLVQNHQLLEQQRHLQEQQEQHQLRWRYLH
eukprot:CAMPEP_0113493902 /NCGR_PEP_ID=MMETSP0014_2-20120614/28832_1 /TAXON_ID=2857 /ORGANISM="Nitzschia sp." /LENGTH=531 /DNA_ID=CAMNT_0000387781 /DNA_START=242 /DNA_END=1837 /DNA_ORIENTATION=+ /assembly_acc=CAM_ASM_000159